MLYSFHQMAALLVGQEFAISHDESTELAKAAISVAAFYETSAVNPKALAWIGLAGVVANVHGPRIMARGLRMKMEAEERKGQRPIVQARQPISQTNSQANPHIVQPMARPTLDKSTLDAFSDPSFVMRPAEGSH